MSEKQWYAVVQGMKYIGIFDAYEDAEQFRDEKNSELSLIEDVEFFKIQQIEGNLTFTIITIEKD